jgi:phage terminase small subunit
MPTAKRKSARLDEDGLDLRAALFVRLYLSNGGNGADASRRAGYKREGNVQACELLKRPEIKKVIDRERRKILSELDAEASRVVKELARVAFLDVRSLFDKNGMLKPIPQLNADAAACIGSFDFRRTLKKGAVSKIRLWSKLAALEMLGRWLKMWHGEGGDESERDRLDEVVEAIRNSPAGIAQQRKRTSKEDD